MIEFVTHTPMIVLVTLMVFKIFLVEFERDAHDMQMIEFVTHTPMIEFVTHIIVIYSLVKFEKGAPICR